MSFKRDLRKLKKLMRKRKCKIDVENILPDLQKQLNEQTEEILSENLRTCSECQKIFESIKLRKNHEHCIHGIGEFIKDEPIPTDEKPPEHTIARCSVCGAYIDYDHKTKHITTNPDEPRAK